MPSADEILDGLTRVARGWTTLAIAWHVVLAVGLVALALGWRPSRRVAGAALVLGLGATAFGPRMRRQPSKERSA